MIWGLIHQKQIKLPNPSVSNVAMALSAIGFFLQQNIIFFAKITKVDSFKERLIYEIGRGPQSKLNYLRMHLVEILSLVFIFNMEFYFIWSEICSGPLHQIFYAGALAKDTVCSSNSLLTMNQKITAIFSWK